MPKISFSAPVYEKYKKMGGDIVYKRGDQSVIRLKGSKSWRKYNMMWRGNQIFQVFSEYFKSVSQISKQHWSEYKAYIGSSRSGRNPYLKNNIQIMYPDLIGTEEIKDISSPPQYPEIPICFAAYYDTDLDGIIYEWLDNYGSETIIEAGYYNAPGLARPPLDWIRIGKGDLSTIEGIFLPGKLFNAGSITYASVRSINLRGEVSPWHDPIAIDIEDRPESDFTGSPRKGPVPLEVVFNDLTTGVIKSWLWTFGDGENSALQHPIHTYEIDQDYFNVKLIAFGVAGSKKSKTRYKYIKITDQPEDFEFFFVSDTSNYRISKRYTEDLSYKSKFGSYGAGNDQFKQSVGIAVDNLYIYVCDQFNNRICKFLKWEYGFIAKYHYSVPDPKALYNPMGVAIDNVYGYIGDSTNDRVIKFTKEDMLYHSEKVTWSGGEDQFNGPYGVAVDDNHLFVCDMFNNRICKFDKSDFCFIDKVGSSGSGDDQFNTPRGIAVDRTYIYIADRSNHRIVKRNKSNLNFVAKVGSRGSGDTQFEYPDGITVGAVHLYIADTGNHRTVKLLKSDLSFISKIGTQGSGNDQFKSPKGTGIMSPYSYQ